MQIKKSKYSNPKQNELFVDSRNLYGYRFIPKIATTSILNTLLTEEYKLQNKERPKNLRAHQFARAHLKDFSSVQNRIIVIRDPISRFLSGYDNCLNRGKFENSPQNFLNKEFLKNFLKTKSLKTIKKHFFPSGGIAKTNHEINFNSFVEDFGRFNKVKFIRWHLATLETFIGPRGIDNFNIVIKINEIVELEKFFTKIYEKPIKFSHRNKTTSNKTTLADINKNSFDFLMDYTSNDYDMLSDYYQKDLIFAAWKDQRNI